MAVSTPKIVDLRQGSEESTEALLLQCLHGLQQPEGKKSLPTILLYDQKGLQIFDRITYLEEYYPTNAEAEILKSRSHELVRSLPDDAVLVELGAGYVALCSLMDVQCPSNTLLLGFVIMG